jgi:hypothetical protein
MLRKSLSVFCLIVAIMVAMAGAIWAAVPLTQVQAWQNSAPEALTITALSIDKVSETRPFGNSGSLTTTLVTLTARVDVVHRTVSGLAEGSMIVVRYSLSLQDPPPPGIQQEIVLNAGERATAYLKQENGKNYILACPFGCLERP